MKTVDLDLARRLLDYDPETGVFTWSAQHPWPEKRGKRAGTLMRNGTIFIRFSACGTRFAVYAHRLAYAFAHGTWPRWVKHVDDDISNNRVANLVEGSAQDRGWNMRKRRSTTTSRFKGVHWSTQHGKWHACIQVGGRKRHLGTFDDEEVAGAAYARAAARVAGEFARVVT